MNKKILASVLVIMLVSHVGFAAPILDIKQGETNLGIQYSNPDMSGTFSGRIHAKGFYIETGLTDKWILGLQHGVANDTVIDTNQDSLQLENKSTTLYVQYQIDKNFRLLTGKSFVKQTISYSGVPVGSGSENNFMYGVAAKTKLGHKLDGYAAWSKEKDTSEWGLGMSYDLTKDMKFFASYSKSKTDGLEMKGFSFGLNHKF